MSIVPQLGFVSAQEVREAALTVAERARLRRRVGLSTQQQNAARVERAYHQALGIDRPLSPAIRDSECAIVYNRRSEFGPHLWFVVRIDPMPGALAAHADWIGLTAASPALIGVSVSRGHLPALLSQIAVPVLVEAIDTARWSTRAFDSRDAARSKIRVGQCEARAVADPHRPERDLVLALRRVQLTSASPPFRLCVSVGHWASVNAGAERAGERVVRARGWARLEGPCPFTVSQIAPERY